MSRRGAATAGPPADAPLAFLTRERAAILDDASEFLGRSGAGHYGLAGPEQARRRCEVLYDEVLAAVAARDLGGIVGYAQRLAGERFAAGYDLSEVQSAFNALEEAAWKRAVARLEPERLAETLGLVGTVLGAAKDALAREYVSLATRGHAPSLDLRALFAGGVAASVDGERSSRDV